MSNDSNSFHDEKYNEKQFNEIHFNNKIFNLWCSTLKNLHLTLVHAFNLLSSCHFPRIDIACTLELLCAPCYSKENKEFFSQCKQMEKSILYRFVWTNAFPFASRRVPLRMSSSCILFLSLAAMCDDGTTKSSPSSSLLVVIVEA